MKPLKLIIEGFETYCKKTIIDFTKLSNTGLFLICGDTGAGKSTIFDAITFALFGKGSGENREKSMFRSTFATPDIPTQVDFTFEFRGDIFNIKRNPSYERYNKKGGGTTTENPNATLTQNGSSLIIGDKIVTNKIISILGIDKDQFCQIAMIAQGNFQKILFADTETRQMIFRQIFKTSKFEQLTSRLNEIEKELRNQKQELQNRINDNLLQIQNEEFKKINLQGIKIEEKIEFIKKVIKSDKKNQQKIQKKITQNENELSKTKIFISQLEKIKEDKNALIENQEKVKILTEKIKILTLQKDEQTKNLQNSKLKENEIILLKEKLPDYEKHDKLSNSMESLKIQINKSSQKKEELQNEIEEKKSFINSIENQLVLLKNSGEEKITLENEFSKITEKGTSLKNLSEKIINLQNNQEKLIEIQNQYLDLSKKLENSQNEVQNLSKQFLDFQAGILASSLKENEECPVCGSKNHPKLAEKPDFIPTENEINISKNKFEKTRQETEEKSKECAVLKNQNENEQKEILQDCKIFNISTEDFSKINEKISLILDELRNQAKNLQKEIVEKSQEIEKKQQLEIQLPNSKNYLENKTQELAELNNQLIKQIADYEKDEKTLIEIKNSLKFKNQIEAKNQIELLENEVQKIQKIFEQTQNDFLENEKSITNLLGAQNEIQKRLEENPKIDENEILIQQETLLFEKQQLTNENQMLFSNIQINEKSLEKIEEYSQKLTEIEHKHLIALDLSKTANGTMIGKEKIMLETFIQMTYFDKIVRLANLRLKMISGGKYELIRKTAEGKTSKTGLELDVIDHFNGGIRSVKTLSGGETFEASLSLALGLSDEISSSSGGIKIDSMFIDEGFGSLDNETLQSAIKALNIVSQSNKMIGIISHVEALKQKIENQIIVKKTREQGSYVEIVCGN